MNLLKTIFILMVILVGASASADVACRELFNNKKDFTDSNVIHIATELRGLKRQILNGKGNESLIAKSLYDIKFKEAEAVLGKTRLEVLMKSIVDNELSVNQIVQKERSKLPKRILKLLNSPEPKLLKSIEFKRNPVTFSNDLRYVVFWWNPKSEYGPFKPKVTGVFDLKTNKTIVDDLEVKNSAYLEKYFTFSNDKKMMAVTKINSVEVINLESGRREEFFLAAMEDPTTVKEPSQIVFAPDNKTIYVSSYLYKVENGGRTGSGSLIEQIDLSSKNIIRQLQDEPSDLVIDAESKHIILSSYSNYKIFDLELNLIKSFDYGDLAGFEPVFSTNGKYLFISKNEEFSDNKQVLKYKVSDFTLESFTEYTSSNPEFYISHDGTQLAHGKTNSLNLYVMHGMNAPLSSGAPVSWLRHLVFSENNDYFIAEEGGVIKIWRWK